MKDLGEKAQKDFIYKVIKYSDNEVIGKMYKFEKIATKTISNNTKKIAYMSFFM